MVFSRRGFVAALGATAASAAVAVAPRRGSAAARRRLRLLILGGTGFLGPHVVDAARARGHTVTLFNRGKTRPALFPDVEKLRGDRDGHLEALEGRTWDAVIDDCGYVPRVVGASAALLARAVRQYLYVSSVSAYAQPVPPGADENAPLAPPPPPGDEDVVAHYGALKALCERAAEAAMPGRVTVIRPGLIVGPGDATDRFTYWPARFDRGGDVLCPGDGRDPVQFVDARDLAAFAVTAVERGHVGTFNAAGPSRTLIMADLVAACRRAAGDKATPVWVAAAFLEAEKVVPWVDLPVWTGGPPGDGFVRLTSARALARGLSFRALSDTVADTLAWWRGQPAERRASLHAGLTPAREAVLLAAWRTSQSARKPG